ncbi:Xanthine dehydrogenase iron-sulfur subunit [Clostridiaceae bacterium JG1575]|nr:Xanthine dehydrogenase iron-sulfur subunit [Clostridiaceae bacterium JG1575]
MKETIRMTVNGRARVVEIDPRETLQEVLRQRLHLTGLKIGCGVGECGACTVILNGRPVDSCLILGVLADGGEITTVEGLAKDGKPNAVQQSFVDHGAVQCGFCTSGLVLTATALAQSGKSYTREEIKKEVTGHLCRCTGYAHVIDAIWDVCGTKEVGSDE